LSGHGKFGAGVRVVLTGAEGNLGSAIRKAGGEHEIVPITRANWRELEKKLEPGDIVIHAASDLTTLASEDPEGVLQSNLMTTVELLKAMDKVRPSKFYFISSCAVYGHSEITREDEQPAPISVNGVTKLLNEKLITEYCEARKMDYTVLRVFNTFGGRDRFSIIQHLNRAIEKKVPFRLNNNGQSQRDFVFVEDVAAIVLGLFNKKSQHKILNLGSGEATKIKDIVTEFQKKNKSLEIVHTNREETEYSRADISRLRELFPDYRFKSVLDFLRDS
jgi:UDP-glucose 4-epimerase